MITQALFDGITFFWNGFLAILPPAVHFPAAVFTAANALGAYAHVLDFILPVNTLYTTMLWIWGIHLFVFAVRSTIKSMVMAAIFRKIFSLFG